MKERGEVRPEDVPLIPHTTQQMEDMLKLCCHRNIVLPKQVSSKPRPLALLKGEVLHTSGADDISAQQQRIVFSLLSYCGP